MAHDKFGREIPDTTPVAIPARRRVDSRSLSEMRRLIREEMSREAMEQGQESFAEADDFDVDDDGDVVPVSVHEYTEMQEEHLRESVAEVLSEKEKKKVRDLAGDLDDGEDLGEPPPARPKKGAPPAEEVEGDETD